MCRSRREPNEYLVLFTCKNRRRYSRERAPRSLKENSIHYSFASLEVSAALLASDQWHGALRTWAAHSRATSEHLPVAYRVATQRRGEHGFSSKELDAALGDAISTLQPDWHVNLEAPQLLFICLLAHRRLTIGLLLPPFEPRRSDVLPLEPRAWMRAGKDRPHMRPSRAALLVRLAALQPNDRVLDPCGGIGVICIEAASLAAVHAISIDIDAVACSAASTNALAAAQTGALRGSVSVVHGDGLHAPLPSSSIDVAIADLPFGLRHARLDPGLLMRELARLLPVEGRAIVFGSSGPSGSATACAKVTRKQQAAAWRLAAETACCAGGIECVALHFERLGGGKDNLAGKRKAKGETRGGC